MARIFNYNLPNLEGMKKYAKKYKENPEIYGRRGPKSNLHNHSTQCKLEYRFSRLFKQKEKQSLNEESPVDSGDEFLDEDELDAMLEKLEKENRKIYRPTTQPLITQPQVIQSPIIQQPVVQSPATKPQNQITEEIQEIGGRKFQVTKGNGRITKVLIKE